MGTETIIALIAGPCGMAVVAWYLITRTLPQQKDDFLAELKAFRDELKAIREELKTMREKQFEGSKAEAAAVAKVENRLARIEAVIVSESDGRLTMETGVGIRPHPRKLRD